MLVATAAGDRSAARALAELLRGLPGTDSFAVGLTSVLTRGEVTPGDPATVLGLALKKQR